MASTKEIKELLDRDMAVFQRLRDIEVEEQAIIESTPERQLERLRTEKRNLMDEQLKLQGRKSNIVSAMPLPKRHGEAVQEIKRTMEDERNIFSSLPTETNGSRYLPHNLICENPEAVAFAGVKETRKRLELLEAQVAKLSPNVTAGPRITSEIDDLKELIRKAESPSTKKLCAAGKKIYALRMLREALTAECEQIVEQHTKDVLAVA